MTDKQPSNCLKHNCIRTRKPSGYVECKQCNQEYYQSIKDKRKQYVDRNKQKIKTYHDEYREKSLHSDYYVWSGMKQRCYNSKIENYSNYGGRGITVCDRWRHSFENFIKDMGPRPEPKNLYSIERKNVDGNYEPNNCIWATAKEQHSNKRSNVKRKESIPDNSPVCYQDKILTLKEFGLLIGVPLIVVKYRYAQHANPEWITYDDYDNRYYEYKGHKYNLTELSLLSGISFKNIHKRIRVRKWSVGKAVETPLAIR